MSRMAVYGPPFLLAGLILLVCASAESRPGDPQQAAAIFPPWWTGSASLGVATRLGAVVGLGRAPFIVIIHGAGPDLPARARAAGALFVVDGARFGLCAR